MSDAVRNAAAGMLLLAISVALSLALGELAVRALDAWRGRGTDARLDRVEELAREAGVGPDTFNAYYFGESTMAGVPYDPRMSIPKLVDRLLDGHADGRPLRSVNLAQSGQEMSFHARRAESVLERPELFHASVLVIQAGHNEFLKFMPWTLVEPESASAWRRWLGRSRLLARLESRLAALHPLDVDDRQLFDRPCATPATQDRVRSLYQQRLAQVLDRAAERGVPVILSTVPGNVSDWEPSRSVYCGPEAQRDAFAAMLDAAAADERTGRDADARMRYRDALAICDRFAELRFRLGRLEERAGNLAAARDHYQAALDADAMPLRATGAMNDAVRALARERDVPLVDPVLRFAELSQRAAPGYDWFVDAHHPNATGVLLIANDVAAAIRARFGGEPLAPLDEAAAVDSFALTEPGFVYDKAIERGRWFTRIATLRFDPHDRLERAASAFEQAAALSLERADPVLGLAMIAFLQRDAASGERALQQARLRDAAGVEEYLRTPWVRAVQARAQRSAAPGDSGYSPPPASGPEDR